MKYLLPLLAILAVSSASCDSGHRKAKVIKMAAIYEPSNLANNDECIALWSNIQKYGIDMDDGRDDWNQIIIESAYQLIQKGCVKANVSQMRW